MDLLAAGALSTPALAQGVTEKRDVVTIYGDRKQTDPGSYSTIDAATIADVGANTPAEILNTVPGVNIQMNSGQEMLVSIRSPVLPAGAGQGSFLILEDGVPIRAAAFGNVNELFEVHHETAEQIEVVRGPASVRYGSNAVHGLINIIDAEPAGAPGGYTATVSASTLNRYRADGQARFTVGPVANILALSDTHEIGWRDHSGVELEKLTFRSGVDLGKWRAVSTISGIDLNQNTAGFIIGKDAYKNLPLSEKNPNPEAYRDAWAARTNVRFERDMDNDFRVTITPFALTQRMIFIQHFLPDQSTEKNGQDSFGVLARYEFGPKDVHWTIGADVQWADGSLKEIQSKPTFSVFPKGVHYDYDVETLMAALYAELDWRFAPNWKALAGLRTEANLYDYTTNKAPGVYGRFRVPASRTDRYDLLTPKFGVLYDGLRNVVLYANYARGERAPQASDQYRLQNLQTDGRLRVETLDSLEIGLRGEFSGVSYDVAAWGMHKDNFFFRDADGLNVPDGKTKHVGIDASLNGALPAGFSWRVNATWSDQSYDFNRKVATASEIIVKGAQIDTAPEWLGDASLTWRSGPVKIEGGFEYVGKYFTDAANLHTYPGHVVGRLKGSWTFNDRLEAFVTVRNVTDVRYADRADFASGQDRYFPGEPLNATFGIKVKG